VYMVVQNNILHCRVIDCTIYKMKFEIKDVNE
jgi:hypothetical protein